MFVTILKKSYFSIVKDIAEVIAGSIVLGFFAKIMIPLFFTPVPLVLQNSLAISYALFFKKQKAAASVLLFIFLGAIGFPFFSNGNYGFSYLASTTGGYIFGYFFACYIAKALFDRLKNKTTKNISYVVLLAHLIVLITGSLWFSIFVGINKAILLGLLPFIPLDIIKTIAIAKVYKKAI